MNEKMQKENKDCRISNTSEPVSNENLTCCSGAHPRVKKQFLNEENKTGDAESDFQGDSKSLKKQSCTLQNGAGCSSWLSGLPLPSTSSSSPPLNDVTLPEKMGRNDEETKVMKTSAAKNKNLYFKQNNANINDPRRKLKEYEEADLSENEGDEALSGDECIYTYKGDQFADLPNSLFAVLMTEQDADQQSRDNQNEISHRLGNQQVPEERSNPESSPEMDYLEMDFDPGPSLEHDSEEDFHEEPEKKTASKNLAPDLLSEQLLILSQDSSDSSREITQNGVESEAGPSNGSFHSSSSPKSSKSFNNCSDLSSSSGSNNNNNNNNNNNRTKNCVDSYEVKSSYFCKNGDNCDLESDLQPQTDKEDKINKFKSQPHGDKRLGKKISLPDNLDLGLLKRECEKDVSRTSFDEIMLWTEKEAISNQVTLVSSEVSCGATAVINVMLVLKMRFSIENVKEGLCTRLRTDSASIPQYLVSRSFAGVAHENLIRGIHHASHGTLFAKFFHMYPRRNVVLSRWLCRWMEKGAVPIATMNVQRESSSGESSGTDTRHHQMVFGVDSKGIHLTNPMECLEDEELWTRLISPSMLNIKRQEIVSRWSPDTSLKPLMFQSDDRWRTMNVLGQVANIIRELHPDSTTQGKFHTQHISIPASSGITLVISRDSPGYEELAAAPDLPLSSASK